MKNYERKNITKPYFTLKTIGDKTLVKPLVTSKTIGDIKFPIIMEQVEVPSNLASL